MAHLWTDSNGSMLAFLRALKRDHLVHIHHILFVNKGSGKSKEELVQRIRTQLQMLAASNIQIPAGQCQNRCWRRHCTFTSADHVCVLVFVAQLSLTSSQQ